jgi:hypothetical protein
MISTLTVDGLERVERAGLEEIAAEVAALWRLREDNPAVLAEALTRIAIPSSPASKLSSRRASGTSSTTSSCRCASPKASVPRTEIAHWNH